MNQRSRQLVPDASAFVDYLLSDSSTPAIRALIGAPDAVLHVPALCDVEFSSALNGAVRRREIAVERAREALDDYLDLPLQRHEHPALLPRVFELRANFSAYDATYVALAERLSATLVTSDSALASAVRALTRLNVIAPTP